MSLIAASFAAALIAGQFKPSWPTRGEVLRGLGGGALSSWVFGFAVFGGVAASYGRDRRAGWLALA